MIERNIYFFTISALDGVNVDSSSLRDHALGIDGLPWDADSTRYWDQPDGDSMAMWVDSPLGDCFQLANLRRAALPQSEFRGELSSLNLGDEHGLHEPAHIKVFDDGIIGMEFNYYGPRSSRLPRYIQHVFPNSALFRLDPLLRRDVTQRLNELDEIRVFEFEVRRNYLDQVAEANARLSRALELVGEGSGSEVVGISLRPDRNSRRPLSDSVFGLVRSLLNLPDLRENARKMKIRGKSGVTGRVEPLDLLQDQLVTSGQFVTVDPTSRAVVSDSAYEQITSAYRRLRPELRAAAGLNPAPRDD